MANPIKQWIDNLYENSESGVTRDSIRAEVGEWACEKFNVMEADVDGQGDVWIGGTDGRWIDDDQLEDFSQWIYRNLGMYPPPDED